MALALPWLLTAALHLGLLRWPGPAAGPVLTLSTVERVDSRSLVPPEEPGQPTTLPLLEPAPPHGGRPQAFWLRARFALAEGADSTWTLELGHRTPVLVFLDGRLLAHSVPVDEADLPPRNLHIGNQRLAVSVPPDWLGRGEHALSIRIGAPGAAGTSVGRLRLGPAPAMQRADAERRAWLVLRTVTALGALVIGVFLLSAWLVNRSERLYLGAALHALLLALLLSPYLLAEPPIPAPWWRMLLDVADVAAKALLLAVVAAAVPGLAWAGRLALAYAAIGMPIDAWAAWERLAWTDFSQPWPWWALGSRFVVLLLAVASAAYAWWRQNSADRLGTLLLTGFSLAIWSDVSFFALVLPGRVPVLDLNVLAYAGWALWVGALLHRRLLDTRRREAELRDELARQLEQRTAELKRQFDALQESESARRAAEERERLLQEMHDGLGAQLTAAKMLAGDATQDRHTVVRALEDCLRELRLAVDALSVTDGDLGLLLGSLRHRLEPGLRAAGMTLQWQVEATPHLAALRGAQARELARIVQEAFSNIVHHAGATEVRVSTRQHAEQGRLRLAIEDDGLGIDPARPQGRGLRNMRQRAQRLQAEIRWLPGEGGRGTRLELDLPLDGSAPLAT